MPSNSNKGKVQTNKVGSSVKNPFEPSGKKETIRRKAEEIYPDERRRILLHPKNTGTKPIDKLFKNVEGLLEGDLEDITVDGVAERMDIKGESNFDRRCQVVEKLLDILAEIQNISLQEKEKVDKNLITISLHDMKTLGKLFNVILILGLYPALNTFGIGIPLEKRNLKGFAMPKKLSLESITPDYSVDAELGRFGNHEKILTLIYAKLFQLFSVDSDVKDLLLRGTGYSDFVTVSISLITVPYFSFKIRHKCFEELDEVLSLTETYDLFEIFTLLISTRSPSFFKSFVMSKLQSLHYSRVDGLLALIEFVLGLRENQEINVVKFDQVANVVLRKPKEISSVAYFLNLGTQFYDLLVDFNRPWVTNCVGFLIERLWFKNKLIIQDFFLKRLWHCFNPINEEKDLDVLVSEKELNDAINVLLSLSKRDLPKDLLRGIFEPILLPLWAYFSFLRSNSKSPDVVMSIIVSYFTLADDDTKEANNSGAADLDIIAKNILYQGGDQWLFEFGPNGLVQITRRKESFLPVIDTNDATKITRFMKMLDDASDNFAALLTYLDSKIILLLYTMVFKRWLKLDALGGNSDNRLGSSSFFALIDMKIAELLGDKFQGALVRSPQEILEVVKDVLLYHINSYKDNRSAISNDAYVENEDSDDDDLDDASTAKQAISATFELLSAILTETPSRDLNKKDRSTLSDILNLLSEPQIEFILQEDTESCKTLARKVSSYLEEKPSSSSEVDKALLGKAISGLNDPLIPVRVHGLFTLKQLVEKKSEAISLDFAMDVYLKQLSNSDPYMYLNVIKHFQSLIEWDQIKICRLLLRVYTNEDGKNEMEVRLRIGEIILRYVQYRSEAFMGETASMIVSSMIYLIRRREDNPQSELPLRMSAMSIMGICCRTNPLGVINNLEDVLDAAFGVLELERGADEGVMRRAAIVLIHDLIMGTAESNVDYPPRHIGKTITLLNYISETDSDLLVREQVRSVLEVVEQIGQDFIYPYDEESSNQLDKLRIV